MTIRPLLGDDRALVPCSLATLLDPEPDMTVVAEGAVGDEIAPAARDCQTDTPLLDVKMSGTDGIEAPRCFAPC